MRPAEAEGCQETVLALAWSLRFEARGLFCWEKANMASEKKAQTVDHLAQLLAQSPVVIATSYRGMTMVQMTELRQRLRKIGAEYHVVKNTLVSLAGERSGRPGVGNIVTGPTAIAFSSGDPAELTKAILGYVQSSGAPLTLAGALLDGQVLMARDVAILATLPPRNVILGQVIGGLQSPLRGLVYVLSSQVRGLAWVLQSRMKQLEQGG